MPGAAATEIELAKRVKEFSFKETGYAVFLFNFTESPTLVNDMVCILFRGNPHLNWFVELSWTQNLKYHQFLCVPYLLGHPLSGHISDFQSSACGCVFESHIQ